MASWATILIINSNFHGFVILLYCFSLNKLDTLSNEIDAVTNPRVGYVTTNLWFLHCVDPSDSISNYYVQYRKRVVCQTLPFTYLNCYVGKIPE